MQDALFDLRTRRPIGPPIAIGGVSTIANGWFPIRLEPGVDLRGSVLDANGKPVPGARNGERPADRRRDR